MRKRGDFYRIGDNIEMKLRHRPSAVFPARIADVRNLGLNHYVLSPERMRIPEFTVPKNVQLTQRQGELDRERFQFRHPQAAMQNAGLVQRNLEFSKMTRLPHRAKVSRSGIQSTLKHMNAKCARAKAMHPGGSTRFVDTVGATLGDPKKQVNILSGDTGSLPKPYKAWAKFFADFAKECFVPPKEVPRRREKNDRTDINVEAPPEVVAGLFDRDIQNNTDDAFEEKEIRGNEPHPNIAFLKKPETVDVPNGRYPEENFAPDRIDEAGQRLMNVNIFPIPQGQKPALQQYNINIYNDDR